MLTTAFLLRRLVVFLTSFLMFIGASQAQSDYYWVGDSGDWSDFANHWATTSGGSTFHSQVPTNTDTVYFDVNSFSIPDQVVSVDVSAEANTMDWTGVSNTPEISSANSSNLTLYGSLTLSAGITFGLNGGDLIFNSDSIGNTISSTGVSFDNNIRYDGAGEWILQDGLTTLNNWSITINSGTVISDGYPMSTGSNFSVNGGTFDMGGATITAIGWNIGAPTLLTGTSTIIIEAGASLVSSFFGGGEIYNDVIIRSTGKNTNLIGSNTFNNLTIEEGVELEIQGGSTQTVNQLTITGTPAQNVSVSSLNPQTQATISQIVGTINASWTLLQDINAIGGATFDATDSYDLGNNSGWSIVSPTPDDFYWVGNGGNWSDFSNHWSTTSGGSADHLRVPGPTDNVYFDVNSFSIASESVTLDISTVVGDVDWTGVVNNPFLSSHENDLTITGSLTLSSEVYIGLSNGNLIFNSNSTGNTINTAGASISNDVHFEGTGEWILQDDLVLTDIYGRLELKSGSLLTNDFGLRSRSIILESTLLDLGASIVRTAKFYATLSSTITPGTSTIIIENLNGFDSNFTFDGADKTYHNLEFIADDGPSTINGDNTFNDITINKGAQVQLESGTVQSVNQFFVNGTSTQNSSLTSSSGGSQATISQLSGSAEFYFTDIRDIVATGGAIFTAINSVDLGNNTGIVFNPPPTIASVYPPNGSSNIPLDTTLSITFDENVFVNLGAVNIFYESGNLAESIDITLPQVTGDGTATITINPVNDFLIDSSYYVTLSPDIVLNGASDPFVGISSPLLWTFSTPRGLENDSLALVALYDSTNGAGWSNSANWKVGPVDTWYGVTVTNGRVTQLEFYDNNLTGQIPTQIGDLDQLQSLVISQNSSPLLSQIPPEIGNLSNLMFLHLEGEGFSGVIPPEIGNLTNLFDLQIHAYDITGSIPSEIGNLTALSNLEIYSSRLQGGIPSTIGNLVNLTDLHINGDSLSGPYPVELGALTNLSSLGIYYPSAADPTFFQSLTNLASLRIHGGIDFSGQIPPEFSTLSTLTSLTIYGRFTGNFPVSLTGLNNLNQLDINAELDGPVPSEIGNMGNLQYLKLAYNNLDSIPAEIGNLTSLITLDLSGNAFSGSIPPEIGNLSNLQYLNLRENQFRDSIPPEIGNLVNLYELDLSNNYYMSGPIPPEIGNLLNLGYLDLSNIAHYGTIPPEIGNLTSLYYLALGPSNLEGSVPTEFSNLVNLQTLYLNSCRFTDLPDLSGLPLSSFDVRNNYFDFADLEPNGSLPIQYSPQRKFGPGYDTLIAASSNLDLTYSFGSSSNNYQWKKNGLVLTGETNDTLFIPNAAAADNGLYVLEVTNNSLSGLTLSTEIFNVAVEGTQTVLTKGPEWSAAFAFGSDKQTSVTAIEIDENGNIIMYGNSNGSFDFFGQPVDNLDSGAFLTKLDPEYNVLWLKQLRGTSCTTELGDQLVYDKSSGNQYLTGTLINFYDDGDTVITSSYPGEVTSFVVKTNSIGDMLWFKEYAPGVNVQDLSVGVGLAVSGVFGADVTIEGQGLTNQGSDDFFLSYYLLDGTNQFVRSGGGNLVEYHFLTAMGSSYLYATAEATSPQIIYENGDTLTMNEGDGNVLVIQYDFSGNRVWERTYSGSTQSFGDNSSWPTSITIDANNFAFIKGWYGSESAWDTDTLISPFSNNKYLAKIDGMDGAVVWVKSIFEEQYGFDYNEMEVDENNNVYFMAQARGDLYFDGAQYSLQGGDDTYIIKYSNAGELNWIQTAPTSPSGTVSLAAMGVGQEDIVYIGGRFSKESYDLGSFSLSSTQTFHGFIASIGMSTKLPPSVADQTFAIPENSLNGAIVDTVEYTSVDSVTFEMVSGTAVGVFEIDSLTGIISVLDSAAVDYESSINFDFTVAISNGDSTTTAIITIDVLPVNEIFTVSDSVYFVDQSAANNSSIGFIKAEDPDFDDLLFSLSNGNTDGAFTVVDTTGQLLLVDNSVLDYDVTPQYNLTIEITDGEFTESVSAQIKITSLTSDRLALIAFQDEVGGDLTNWGNATFDNPWEGVTVANGRVRKLELPDASLSGVVPAQFGDLTGLDSIDLSNNDLQGFPDITYFPVLSFLDLTSNNLPMREVLKNIEIINYEYTIQNKFGQSEPDTLIAGTDTVLQVTNSAMIAPRNNYQWYFRPLNSGSSSIIDGADSIAYTLTSIDYDKMGSYHVVITNELLDADFTIESNPLTLRAATNIEGIIYKDDEGNPLEAGLVDVFRIGRGPYFLEDSAVVNSDGSYKIEGVVLGDFIVKVTPEGDTAVLQTYFVSQQDWVDADTLYLREAADQIDIQMQFNPGDFMEDPENTGFVRGTLEDLTSSDGRVTARRKVKKAGCSLRRRTRTGGGREDQEEFVYSLVAYVETDDDGNFAFNNIAAGYYRINIQYPGIPMDKSSQIEFEIGEDKENSGFRAKAQLTDEGIVVNLEEVLGILKPYLKNTRMYPNPSKDIVNFDYLVYRKMDILEMKVYDMKGHLIEKRLIPHQIGTHSAGLDLSEQSSGVYFIHLRNEDSTFSINVKVIKN